MRLNASTWERHANTCRGRSRVSILPLLAVAIWILAAWFKSDAGVVEEYLDHAVVKRKPNGLVHALVAVSIERLSLSFVSLASVLAWPSQPIMRSHCQNGVCEIGYESTSETVVELPYRIY